MDIVFAMSSDHMNMAINMNGNMFSDTTSLLLVLQGPILVFMDFAAGLLSFFQMMYETNAMA